MLFPNCECAGITAGEIHTYDMDAPIDRKNTTGIDNLSEYKSIISILPGNVNKKLESVSDSTPGLLTSAGRRKVTENPGTQAEKKKDFSKY